jgi:hypothetical protein
MRRKEGEIGKSDWKTNRGRLSEEEKRKRGRIWDMCMWKLEESQQLVQMKEREKEREKRKREREKCLPRSYYA